MPHRHTLGDGTGVIKEIRGFWQPCEWPGCRRDAQPGYWGCKPHWYALPEVLRTALQQADSDSAEYAMAAAAAHHWVTKVRSRPPAAIP